MNSKLVWGFGYLVAMASASTALGQAQLTAQLRTAGTMSPGQNREVDFFINNVTGANFLRGYQVTIQIVPQAGSQGTVTLAPDSLGGFYRCIGGTNAGQFCTVANGPSECPSGRCSGPAFVEDTRSDFVFFNKSMVTASIPGQPVFGATLLSSADSVQVTTQKYLGTLIIQSSANALGDFHIQFVAPAPGDSTFLIERTSFESLIPFTTTPLTVSVLQVNALDACSAALQIGDGRTAFSTLNATTDGVAHPGSGCDVAGNSNVNNDIWYKYFASCTGPLTISTCGDAGFDTRVAVYNDCTCPATAGELLTCSDDGPGCTSGTSEATINATAGTCYTIRVGGKPGLSGTGGLTIACVGNDTCASADLLTPPITTTGATINANVDAGLPGCGPTVNSPGVWYSVTGTGGSMSASLCGNATYDSRLSVFSGSCASLTCVAAANDTCASQESVSWCSTAGTQYFILVHGIAGAEGSFSLSVTSTSCDDGNACTQDACLSGVCSNTPVPGFDPVTECCSRATGVETPINDNNSCTSDVCNNVTGQVTHVPLPNGPNAACDDAFGCTLDECFDGACRNTDVEDLFISCTIDANCPGDAVCGGQNFCVCGATIDLIPQPSGNAVDTCYGAGQIFQVVAQLSAVAQSTPIVGAQFFLVYDASMLELIDIEPGVVFNPLSPFTLELNERNDAFTGEVDYLVSVNLGHSGVVAAAPLALLTFQASEVALLSECDPFVEFRASGPNGEPNRLAGVGGTEVLPGALTDLPPIRTDSTAPVLSGCPADRIVNQDPNSTFATVSWTAPTALDNCDGSVAVTCSPPSGSQLPIGTTTVVCSATNACQIEGACSFDVTVIGATLTTTVQLSSTVSSLPFTRCVRFDLWDCTAPGSPLHATVDADLTFVNGIASNATVQIPGGNWNCVTARDRLHTLRSRAPSMTTGNGRDYAASFVGPRPAGHWLLGGNLNDDGFIDILDFAMFMPQFLRPADPDTVCGTPSPDANISGDSVIDLIDFAFIQVNSLAGRESNCCGLPGVAAEAEAGPVTSLTLDDLRRMGLTHLRKADANLDGVIDMSDVEAFIASGGEPDIQKPDRRDRVIRGMHAPPR